MSLGPEPAIRRLLAAAAPAVGETPASWEEVLERALLLTECPASAQVDPRRQPATASGGWRRRGREETVATVSRRGGHLRAEEQGWGTRPIVPARSTGITRSEGMGWGTRPM